MTDSQNKVLLIGPLPPPWGGARVSFKLFYDFLQANSNNNIEHLDIPVRSNRNGNPPGEVNHKKTLRLVLSGLMSIPRVKFVAVFGSRSFCFSYGLVILLVSRLFGKNCHIRFFGGRPMLEFSKRPKLTTAILLRTLALADTISLETAVGASEFPPYIQKKTRVIPGYRSRTKSSMHAKTESVIRFVYVGGLVAVKGVPVLADAYAALGDCASELHLYGTGDPAIVNRLESMNTVFYHGNVENETLRDSLPSYDAFVFPTEYENEGHPGVLIEAFMASLPIIATDMPGINEMVMDGENGLIVPPGDAKLLAEAMRRMVTDDALRANLATGAEKAANLYDEQIVLLQLKEAMGWQ